MTLEFIEEKNDENENNDNFYSDLEYDEDGFDQKISVINPIIPDSLRTPEPSVKKLITVNKKQLKLDVSQIDLNSDVNLYGSNNSNFLSNSNNNVDKLDGRLRRSKTVKRKNFRSGHNSYKSLTKHVLSNKTYSYRRPFSKQKRKFIFVLIFLINILINLDRGIIPAGTTEIKENNNISNAQLGMIGSLLYLGLILGSLSGGYFFLNIHLNGS